MFKIAPDGMGPGFSIPGPGVVEIRSACVDASEEHYGLSTCVVGYSLLGGASVDPLLIAGSCWAFRSLRQTATRIGSGAMHADSRQADFCAYLSAILLGGLLLNATLGWWWADPIAGLIMVPIIGKEGDPPL